MHKETNIDRILKQRTMQETDLKALNKRIISMAAQKPQAEFQVSIINNNAKIIAIAACFVLGMFTSLNLESESLSNEVIDYVYIEEGII